MQLVCAIAVFGDVGSVRCNVNRLTRARRRHSLVGGAAVSGARIRLYRARHGPALRCSALLYARPGPARPPGQLAARLTESDTASQFNKTRLFVPRAAGPLSSGINSAWPWRPWQGPGQGPRQGQEPAPSARSAAAPGPSGSQRTALRVRIIGHRPLVRSAHHIRRVVCCTARCLANLGAGYRADFI